MATQNTEERVDSSFSMGFAASELKKKLCVNWIQIKSKLNDLACESTPIEANRPIPTEAELCLLVCSLFPNDFRFPIEDLIIYGMALKMFEGVHNMMEARCRVYDLIKIINHLLPPRYANKLCLWEDKYGHQYVKVLDTARYTANLIVSRYQLAFSCETAKIKQANTCMFEYCYGLSLMLNPIKEHRVDLKCLVLALLQLQHRKDSQSISIDFFEGIKDLFQSLNVPSLSEPFYALSNLRTLRLKVFNLEDMSAIGCLENLELLSISTSSLTDIPKEMGQLGNMKLLDLRKMNIGCLPPGVLSRMLKLEELYLPLSFRRWGCRAQEENDDYDEWGSWEQDDKVTAEINNGERINANISEIMSLSLNALQVMVPKASILHKRSTVFKNMKAFKILMPNNLKYKPFGHYYSTNVLQLTGDAHEVKDSGICDLLSRTEDLSLIRVKSLKNVMYELEEYYFPQLQRMIISECDELEYVVDTTEKENLSPDCLCSKLESLHLSMLSNLKEICNARMTKLRWFENLSHVSIRFCCKLKYVLPLSVVRGCTLLKTIEVLDCNEMEGIFYLDDADDDDNNPLLCCFIEEIELHSLPKFLGFSLEKDGRSDRIHDGSDELITDEDMSNNIEGSIDEAGGNVQLFPTNERTSRLNGSCIDDEELICLPPTPICTETQRKLVSKKLNHEVTSHMDRYCAFSSRLADKWLQNLKKLKIAFCDSLEVIFSFEEKLVTSRAAFDSLKELELYGLRNLIHIWFLVPVEIVAFKNLQLLVLSECQNLYLCSPRVAKLLVQLQNVYINRCDKMEEIIVEEDENGVEDKIVFPQLKLLELQHMPNLRIFSSGIYPIELPLLEALKFNHCDKMESFSYESLWTPMLKRMQINGSFYSLSGDLNATLGRYMAGNCCGTPTKDSNPSSIISTEIPSPASKLFSAAIKANPNSQMPAPNSKTSGDIFTAQSAASASEPNEEANPKSQGKSSTISLNTTAIEGSSNYATSDAASDASEEANKNNLVERSTFSSDSSTPGSSNDTYCEPPTITSIPTSHCSVAASEANEDTNPNVQILEGPNFQILEGPNFMKELSFDDLKIATKNFSSDNVLGQGGYGEVYIGWVDEKTFLPSKTSTGMAIAVKRCRPLSAQGLPDWPLEGKILERLSHPNVVKLLGRCMEDGELLLVCEFMQRGTLREHLYGSNANIGCLSWDMRIKIVIGVARGLDFLHTLEHIVIHGDVKTTNILLDSDYNPKIVDFGLAKLVFSDGDSHNDYATVSDLGLTALDPLEVSTSVKGTWGYLDPYYARTNRLDVKSDVYSFGVVLLELMTGLKPADLNRPEKQQSLVQWIRPMVSDKKKLKDVMDSRMQGQYLPKAMLLTAKLASKCTRDDPTRRPTMGQVLKELQRIHSIKEKEIK